MQRPPLPTRTPRRVYGTYITEGNASDGWDHNPLGAAVSIKKYNSATDTWVPIANTNATAVNVTPYLVFIRGDRGVPLGNSAAPATATTLRATGTLRDRSENILSGYPVSAQGFTAIPNPIASPINFAALRRSNVQNDFYLWDPKMGGEYGVGGWVLLSYNGSSYDVIPASVSPESQYIQSGQAFMVHSTGSAGLVAITDYEVMTGAGSDNVFRVAGSTQGNGTPFPQVPLCTVPAGLRVSLQTMDGDSSFSVADEVLSSYGSSFSNRIDSMDAYKPSNLEENLSISRDGQSLMIERRQALQENDAIQLKLWNTSANKKYLLEFIPNNLNTTAAGAYLTDSYLHTTTPVDLHKSSRIPFSVNADPASANQYRFSIAFKAGAQLLSDKTGISVYPNPLKGKSIRMSFTNLPQGTYQVELVNGLGQVVHRSQIFHAGGSAIQQVELAGRPAAGTYLLNIVHSSVQNILKVVVD